MFVIVNKIVIKQYKELIVLIKMESLYKLLSENKVECSSSLNFSDEKVVKISIKTKSAEVFIKFEDIIKKSSEIIVVKENRPIVKVKYVLEEKYNDEIADKIKLNEDLEKCISKLKDNGAEGVTIQSPTVPVSHLKKIVKYKGDSFGFDISVPKKSDFYITLLEYKLNNSGNSPSIKNGSGSMGTTGSIGVTGSIGPTTGSIGVTGFTGASGSTMTNICGHHRSIPTPITVPYTVQSQIVI